MWWRLAAWTVTRDHPMSRGTSTPEPFTGDARRPRRSRTRWIVATVAVIVVAVVAIIAMYASLQGWDVLVPPVAIVGGVVASLASWAVAGLYTAMRAARVSPAEALRTL
jgi:hypothetical protein